MGQVDRAPACVTKPHTGRAAAGAGLGQVLGEAPLVAEMKFPAVVEQQPFPRAVGVGGRKAGRQTGKQDDGEKTAEESGRVHGRAS